MCNNYNTKIQLQKIVMHLIFCCCSLASTITVEIKLYGILKGICFLKKPSPT